MDGFQDRRLREASDDGRHYAPAVVAAATAAGIVALWAVDLGGAPAAPPPHRYAVRRRPRTTPGRHGA
ncbi:hypothetical protein ACWENR_09215 [Micromonospora sp. NPDC004336]